MAAACGNSILPRSRTSRSRLRTRR
jgi:hypothetical protein